MKYTNWNLNVCSPSTSNSLIESGVSPLLASVLAARGFCDIDSARSFLDSNPEQIYSPFLMKDMNEAVKRIQTALDKHEKIAVYGDYDVDGITSTALLTSYLRNQGGSVICYIPDRLEEGYGLNPDSIKKLRSKSVSLIITVDCGITAMEEVRLASELGMDVVVTDHHECKDELPDAIAVVNPHRNDCGYPFKELAGVGVALKLVLALAGEENSKAILAEYSDLAAIGTIADVMEVTGENRAIISLGLYFLSAPRRPGLQALIREANLNGKPVTASAIGFTLAPRINASGRMGCADRACELLLTNDLTRSEYLAKDLCALNRERQAIEQEIYNECNSILAASSKRHYSIVMSSENWHQGVVGIVASRLSERYCCPCFMICLQDGKGKGSCRSYGGINLFQALTYCSDLLESFGGHELAAGFTITERNIPSFRARMDQYIRNEVGDKAIASNLSIDAEIYNPSLLTVANVEALDILEPTGTGNPKPLFMMSGVSVLSVSAVGGGRHTKFRIQKDGVILDAIFFSATPQDAGIAIGTRIDIAFSPSINEYHGYRNRTVQLQITDVRPGLTQSQTEQLLYNRYRCGEFITPAEAALLTPSRDDFVVVWKYLTHHTSPGIVEDTAPRLVRKIARTYGLKETYTRTMVCLDVMDERGLIRLRSETDHLQIELQKPTEKVDLEASYILQHLKKLSDG